MNPADVAKGLLTVLEGVEAFMPLLPSPIRESAQQHFDRLKAELQADPLGVAAVDAAVDALEKEIIGPP